MSHINKKDYLIRIVDDDEGLLNGMKFLLKCKGWQAVGYSSAKSFLAEDLYRMPGCLILDIRMPEMSGIELQQEMIRRGIDIPIVILTGHADVDVAVRTLKSGAMDFLQKPVKADELERVLCEVLNKTLSKSSGLSDNEIYSIWRLLSERERQIMQLTADGLTSRVAAERLGLSERTVQGHRQNLLKKFNVHSKSELLACLEVARTMEG